MKETKIKFLKDMHNVVMNKVADEELQMFWLERCVPDQPCEEDFEFIATNDDEWCNACVTFGEIVAASGLVKN